MDSWTKKMLDRFEAKSYVILRSDAPKQGWALVSAVRSPPALYLIEPSVAGENRRISQDLKHEIKNQVHA